MAEDKKIYRELQLHLDKFPIGYPATESGVELKLLELLFNPLEAKIALCLSLTTSTVETVQKRLNKKFNINLPVEELSETLKKLFLAGAIDRSSSNETKYRNAMLAIGMFEFQVDKLTKEFIEYMHQYFDEAFGDEFFSSSLPQLRTSPHMKAIVPEHRIATYDNMREYVKNTNEAILVANCVCKQGEKIIGKPCKQVDDIEICIMFGLTNYLAREQARQISKEECLQILDRAEQSGLVLQPANSLQPFCICLCCGCCCGVLTTAKKLEKPAKHFATNYYVKLDQQLCKSCTLCVKRCQMDAIFQEGKTFTVDLDRCIGCGLCVTKCPAKALELVKKNNEIVPPKNSVQLYLSILKEKVGKKRMMLNMVKMLFGKQL